VRVAYLENYDADQDAQGEEDERDDEPDDTPHCFCELVKRVLRSAHARSNKGIAGLPIEGKQLNFAKPDASETFTFRVKVSSAGHNCSKARHQPIAFFKR
jgi:hypothetical protein